MQKGQKTVNSRDCFKSSCTSQTRQDIKEFISTPLVSRLCAWLFECATDTKNVGGFIEHPREAKEIEFLHHQGLESCVDLWEKLRALGTAERRAAFWFLPLKNVTGP